MNIKRIFCADCYEWKELADLESFSEKPGNYYCADCGCVLIESEDNENTKFEFWLPRNTKNKKLNMVINSNDRDHNKVTGHMVSRIRKLAAYETKAKKISICCRLVQKTVSFNGYSLQTDKTKIRHTQSLSDGQALSGWHDRGWNLDG